MKMKEWDQRMAPRLNVIQKGATWLSYYAGQIQGAVEGLPARPAWETLARNYLNNAEQDLMVALAAVRATKDIYDNLPILVDAAE